MIDILSCLMCFSFTVIAHIIRCRFLAPNKLYAKIFIQFALIGLGVHLLFGIFINEVGLRLFWTSILLYILFIPIYLIVYVSTILMSPSKKILLALSASKEGLSYADLLTVLNGDELIRLRLDELVESGCLIKNDNGFQLSSNGQRIFQFIKGYQFITKRKIRG